MTAWIVAGVVGVAFTVILLESIMRGCVWDEEGYYLTHGILFAIPLTGMLFYLLMWIEVNLPEIANRVAGLVFILIMGDLLLLQVCGRLFVPFNVLCYQIREKSN